MRFEQMLRMIELKAVDGSSVIIIVGPADVTPEPSEAPIPILEIHKPKKKRSQGWHASSKQSPQTAARSRSS
jgi:hypothetical protein